MSETCIPVVNKPPEEATTEAQTTTTTVEDVTCPGVATNDTLTEDGSSCIFPFIEGYFTH